MPSLIGGVSGGLLDDSSVLDSGNFPVLSEQSVELDLRPEFEAEARSRVAPLRERQSSFLTENLGMNISSSDKAVEIAEVFFPPLGIANAAHDAGMLLGEAVVNESVLSGTLGTGLLAAALIPGVPKKGAKSVAKEVDEIVKRIKEKPAGPPINVIPPNTTLEQASTGAVQPFSNMRSVEKRAVDLIDEVAESGRAPFEDKLDTVELLREEITERFAANNRISDAIIDVGEDADNFVATEGTRILKQLSDEGVDDVSRILSADTSVRSKFQKSLDTFKHGDREGFMLVVDPLDGEVVHTVSYDKAKAQDFHHSMFLPSNMAMEVDNGTLALTWLNPKTKSFTNFQAINEGGVTSAMDRRIKEQVSIIPSKKDANEEAAKLTAEARTAELLFEGPNAQTVKGFHGTGSKFDEFADRPTFFALDKEEAAGYAGERSFSTGDRRVIEAELNFKNPASKDDVEKAVKKLDLRMEDFLSQADAAGNEAVVAELKSQGFDGAVGIWDFGFMSDFTEIPVALTFGSGPIKQIR